VPERAVVGLGRGFEECDNELSLAGAASPLTYALDGMRRSLLDGARVTDQLPTIGILLAMGAVMIPASIWIFSWAENRAKRLGLLKRSG